MEYVEARKDGVAISCSVKVNAKETRLAGVDGVSLEVQVS